MAQAYEFRGNAYRHGDELRCMMESNFPVDKQSYGCGVLCNAMKRITQGCPASEKAVLYQETAARVYRLEI